MMLDIPRYKEKRIQINFFEHLIDQAEWDFLISMREEIKEKAGVVEREREFL